MAIVEMCSPTFRVALTVLRSVDYDFQWFEDGFERSLSWQTFRCFRPQKWLIKGSNPELDALNGYRATEPLQIRLSYQAHVFERSASWQTFPEPDS